MSLRAYAAECRRSGQVDLTLGCMRQDHQAWCLIPHIHLVGTRCHRISLHKSRIIKPHLRRNLIRAQALRRPPSTLPLHHKVEVAVDLPAKSRMHHRPSSPDHTFLGSIHLFGCTVQ